ncbi:MAG: DUF2970 domain-containing protein [Pseudomonadales bacterium]
MNHSKADKSSPLSVFEIMGSTFAAAIGVQSSRNRKRDFERGNALHFILAGVLFTIVFVAAVMTCVQWVIGSGL